MAQGPRVPVVAAVLVVVAALGVGLDSYPLLDPDEGRNAEIAREMAASNDYVLPHLNGLPYVDKPVVYFGAAAFFMEFLGPTAVAARLPALVFTLATIGVVWWFGAGLFGPERAWIAPLALAASPLTLGFARTVIFDSALTLFVVIALVAFYRAVEARVEGCSSAAWTALAWSAMAGGVLTKGPIALALPLMVAIPYAAWRRAARSVVTLTAVLAFLALALPWVIAVTQRIPDFLRYVLITETVERLTTTKLRRTGPPWYFIPILLAGSLPWSVVCMANWRRMRIVRTSAGSPDHRTIFLLIWILVPLVFFSLSQSKRPQYVLPLVPAIALLVANLWTSAGGRPVGSRAASIALGVIGAALIVGHSVFDALIDMSAATASAIPPTALALGVIAVGAGTAAWLSIHRPLLAALALAIPVASIPFASGNLMDAIGQERSSRSVAMAMAPLLTDATDVVAIRTFPLSLPFYLQRTVLLATRSNAELTSNYLVRDPPRWRAWPGSPLRTVEWAHARILECVRPTLFVASSDDLETRRLLDRHRLLFDSEKVAVYACGASALVRNGAQLAPAASARDPA